LAVFYCGIDIASKSSYLYVVTKSGRKVTSGEVETTREAFESRLKRYVKDGLTIAIEAGNQTAWIYKALVELGAKVTVVNPKKVRMIAESVCKTDKIDARTLAFLLRLNALPHPVHMPCDRARALRGLLVARRQLISSRTKLCNVVRGMVRQEGTLLPDRALSTLIGWKKLLGNGFSQPHLAAIVSTYFDTFKAMTTSIRELDRQLAECERKDTRAARLRTMPKVGRIAALTFLAAVDDPKRFPSSRKLVGYSGLAPKVRSSGERTEYGSISREGRGELRAVWVQIAHLVAIDTSKATQPLRTWFNRTAKRRGRKTAVVALARRLLVIAYHLLRDETVYDATRLKRRAA
jgi:transposase